MTNTVNNINLSSFALAEKCREKRAELGISMKEAAKQMQVTPATYSKVENLDKRWGGNISIHVRIEALRWLGRL